MKRGIVRINRLHLLLSSLLVTCLVFLAGHVVYANNEDDGADASEVNAGAETKNKLSNDDSFIEYEHLYGEDLSAVPFSLRYAYANDSGKPWEKADYEERGRFIRQWEREMDSKKKEDERDRLAQDREENQRRLRKEREKSAEEQRLEAAAREKERERLEQERKDLEFQRKLEKQKQTLERLRNRSQRQHR